MAMAMSNWQKYDGNDHTLIKKAATTLISKLNVDKEGKIYEIKLQTSPLHLK